MIDGWLLSTVHQLISLPRKRSIGDGMELMKSKSGQAFGVETLTLVDVAG